MHLRELDANLIVILDALLLEASVTKAAERLGRSPSAVSHALARLREVFDDRLFVRAGQRLVPTSRATQLAPTVHIIVSGLEGLLQRDGDFDPHAQESRFTVACRAYLELTVLPAMRAELANFAPGITFERRDEGIVFEGLRAGRVNLAIVEGTAALGANDISAEWLFEEPFIALASETHDSKNVTLELGEDVTVFADAAHIPHLFDTEEYTRPANLEAVASPLIAIHAALSRRGVALVPASVGDLAIRHMRMMPVTTVLRLRPLACHLMWHLSMERDAGHAWVRGRLRKCAEKVGQAAPPEPAAAERR